ncbi:acyl-CoA thioesterase [Actinospongicola halichondriae]|uniref:acyl-CoA thioesterase n=1 Tax=Actinospongicola halichondriae TaxID=3236844 RepID=UPI003D58BE0F
MTELPVTHTSTVTDDQIDHLGHMNVRFYGTNAQRATKAVVRGLGLDTAEVALTDVYTRHHREQLLGARLAVRSGVIETRPDLLRIYHELVNTDDDSLAATFVHGLSRPDGTAFPTEAVEQATIIDIPAHGGSRSIDLDADPMHTAPTLDEVRARGLEMREPRRVDGDECDADGHYIPEFAPMLTWAGVPVGGGPRGDALHDGPNGEKMGWASMETRMASPRLPDRGDLIQSFGALIEMHDKTTHRIQWAFDLETGDLLTSFETVSLAFDTVGRRAMSIPQWIRDSEQRTLQADLAPRAGAQR